MRVLKFGGTSVANVESFTTVVSVVEQNAREDRTAVGLSALGGVTDLPVEACDASQGGTFDSAAFRHGLRDRHAASFIRTNGDFGRAEVNLEESRLLAQPIFNALPPGTIPIVAGFIGSEADGTITTLGRSGSDYTASILGNLLDADVVEIWTDTDGIMSADPRVIHTATEMAA